MFRTKVVALAVLTVFLASVAMVGVVSAQGETNSYYAYITLMGYQQVAQPGASIQVGGMLNTWPATSGINGPVKVYAQRVALAHDVKKPLEPVLMTTDADWNSGWASISFKDPGDYYVYAVFDGATGADGNYYRPSQSGMMEVKVTNQVAPIKMHKPTVLFLQAFGADHQQVLLGSTINVAGQLRSWDSKGNWDSESTVGKTMSVYYQYKKSDTDAWSAPALIKTASQVYGGGYSVDYTPSAAGHYRFQATFAGDKWFDPSASNYVDILVKTPT